MNGKSLQIEDFSREGITFLKLLQLFRLFLPKNTKTLARLNKFTDLNINKLNELKNLNIKGIILDSDDCISYNHGKILEPNIKHIKKLSSQGIKIAIYSNMKKTSRYESIEKYAAILTNLPAKPNIKGFQKACTSLGLPPKNLVMVGDNYITDSGSLKLGIPFIRVKPIKTRYSTLFKKIIMGLYGLLREFYAKISWVHDSFRDPPLTSKELNP